MQTRVAKQQHKVGNQTIEQAWEILNNSSSHVCGAHRTVSCNHMSVTKWRCFIAVAPCRRAGFIKMPGRAYAPLRRCAAAPLPRAWTTMQLVAQASFRCYAAAPSATEQRSNGAELRCCGTDALARSNGARSSGAELRRCGTEHRHGGSEQSNGARSNGGELRRCGQSARSTEHGAEHRSTERSNLEDACSTRNALFA